MFEPVRTDAELRDVTVNELRAHYDTLREQPYHELILPEQNFLRVEPVRSRLDYWDEEQLFETTFTLPDNAAELVSFLDRDTTSTEREQLPIW